MHAPTCALCTILVATGAVADSPKRCSTKVDVKLITAIDISDSVSASEVQLQLTGLAAAVRSPVLLKAIKAGYLGCIGFEVFAWQYGDSPEIVHWTVISNTNDTYVVARQIEGRSVADLYAETRAAAGRFYFGRLTDISGALDHAAVLSKLAPFSAYRSVINIVGEGTDNVAEAPGNVRDKLVDMGFVINGLLVDPSPQMHEYYRREVAGGLGSFVMPAGGGDKAAEAMLRKLLEDLLANNDVWGQASAVAAE